MANHKFDTVIQVSVEESFGYAHIKAAASFWPTGENNDRPSFEGHDYAETEYGHRSVEFPFGRFETRNQVKKGDGDGLGSYAHKIVANVENVDLKTAERIVKAHRTIDRKMEKLNERFGYPRTYGEYVARFADAIGASRWYIYDLHNAPSNRGGRDLKHLPSWIDRKIEEIAGHEDVRHCM